jgi:hypothetical protein
MTYFDFGGVHRGRAAAMADNCSGVIARWSVRGLSLRATQGAHEPRRGCGSNRVGVKHDRYRDHHRHHHRCHHRLPGPTRGARQAEHPDLADHRGRYRRSTDQPRRPQGESVHDEGFRQLQYAFLSGESSESRLKPAGQQRAGNADHPRDIKDLVHNFRGPVPMFLGRHGYSRCKTYILACSAQLLLSPHTGAGATVEGGFGSERPPHLAAEPALYCKRTHRSGIRLRLSDWPITTATRSIDSRSSSLPSSSRMIGP